MRRLACLVLLTGGCGQSVVGFPLELDLLTCTSAQQVCDGTCVEVRRDPRHCGRCGNVCPSGNACVDGQCALSCQQGLTNCAGFCVNPRTDLGHCGACNSP